MPDGTLSSALEEWRKTEQAATPGPWSTQKAVIAGIGGAYVIEHGEDEIALVDCAGDLRLEQELADAEFIAVSRTAMPRLLAAVEAVLELADKLPPQGPPSSALEEDRMWIRQECADMIREAISREITRKGESDA